jgi:hypothetical protein
MHGATPPILGSLEPLSCSTFMRIKRLEGMLDHQVIDLHKINLRAKICAYFLHIATHQLYLASLEL